MTSTTSALTRQVLLLLGTLFLGASAASAAEPATVRPLTDVEKTAMTGVTWRPGCPVGLDALVVVDVHHHGVDGATHQGALVVHQDIGAHVARVFDHLYAQGFVVEQVHPIRQFAGDDDKSMAANNTSAFNCRKKVGLDAYSTHSFGRAVDVNPLWNPYVRTKNGKQKVLPPAGKAFVERTDDVGRIRYPSDVTRIFSLFGFQWGGRWRSVKDYQHFEWRKRNPATAAGRRTLLDDAERQWRGEQKQKRHRKRREQRAARRAPSSTSAP